MTALVSELLNSDPSSWRGPCHVLSLDGGGIRGLFSAAVLAKLEEDQGIRIVDHFDLIVGTSTGGIIALALGMGITPRELVQFYLDHGLSIFPQAKGRCGRWARFFRCIRERRYCGRPLEAALRGVLEERTLGESTKRLVIPSYNLGKDEVRLFKTPHHPRLRRDWRLPAWQVGMATAAAPTFFPVWKGTEGMRLIDGGVWANNPTLVGIVEAHRTLGAPIAQIRVCSLGTFNSVELRHDTLDDGGLWAWRKSAIDVVMRGQSRGTDNLAALILGRERVYRIDPRVPPNLFDLDTIGDTTFEAMLAEAAHASLHAGPGFATDFLGHKSAAYQPIYTEEHPPIAQAT